ncbi:MAG: hypothetical protein AB8G14_00500 [Ilumatobacter sp.]
MSEQAHTGANDELASMRNELAALRAEVHALRESSTPAEAPAQASGRASRRTLLTKGGLAAAAGIAGAATLARPAAADAGDTITHGGSFGPGAPRRARRPA